MRHQYLWARLRPSGWVVEQYQIDLIAAAQNAQGTMEQKTEQLCARDDQVVVLGLVTTKRGELESKDLLTRRIEEAARYVPIEQLCLSPQCGFSSTVEGNALTYDGEHYKLPLPGGVVSGIVGAAAPQPAPSAAANSAAASAPAPAAAPPSAPAATGPTAPRRNTARGTARPSLDCFPP